MSEVNNVPESIMKKVGRNLHMIPNHPVCIIKNELKEFFEQRGHFAYKEDLSPVVNVTDNFDKLLVPADHPSRSKSDTYYVSKDTVLRSHMTAHTAKRLSDGERNFISVGDVYRKDEVDRTHYPVFHQLDAVGIARKGTGIRELHSVFDGIVFKLFGPRTQYRINDDYFPFTEPSFEVEVFHNGNWLEILGGGILHPEITGDPDNDYWAFGVGIERLCMIFFEVPDIRYFWSTSPKFLEQFSADNPRSKFKPYSDLPSIRRDVSFWDLDSGSDGTPNDDGKTDTSALNELCDIVRDIAGDNIESIKLSGSFFHPKRKLTSRTYALTFSPSDSDKDPGLFAKQCNDIIEEIRQTLAKKLHVELR